MTSISQANHPSTNYVRPKADKKVEYFECLCGKVTNDAGCTRENKTSVAMAKAAFNKKKNFFTRQSDLKLSKKPVKYYIWSTTLYGAETWTLGKVDQKISGKF